MANEKDQEKEVIVQPKLVGLTMKETIRHLREQAGLNEYFLKHTNMTY